jgi:hypothetical protein
MQVWAVGNKVPWVLSRTSCILCHLHTKISASILSESWNFVFGFLKLYIEIILFWAIKIWQVSYSEIRWTLDCIHHNAAGKWNYERFSREHRTRVRNSWIFQLNSWETHSAQKCCFKSVTRYTKLYYMLGFAWCGTNFSFLLIRPWGEMSSQAPVDKTGVHYSDPP